MHIFDKLEFVTSHEGSTTENVLDKRRRNLENFNLYQFQDKKKWIDHRCYAFCVV